jgi:hypothetical protein
MVRQARLAKTKRRLEKFLNIEKYLHLLWHALSSPPPSARARHTDCRAVAMDPSQDFKALREGVQAALVTVTRSVNGLASEDLHFQRTVHPPVARRLDQQTDRLLQLASGLLKSAGKLTGQQTSQLEDVDDIEIQWRPVVDVIDSLLEKADTCLDEYTGLVKRKDAPTYDPVCARTSSTSVG